MFVLANVCQAVAMILDKLLFAYSLLIVVAVLVQWVHADPWNPIVQFIRATTEPVFAWIRRRIPKVVVGSFDLSPVVVLLTLLFLKIALVQSLFEFSLRLR